MKTKVWRTLLVCVLTLVLALCAVAATACGDEEKKPDDGTTPGGGVTDTVDEGDICNGMDITKMPTKTTYSSGERFSPSGLIFDATYENGFVEEDLTGGDLDGWRPSGALTEDVTEITLIFEGYEKTIPITVQPKTLLAMEITREPDIKSYSLGDTIDFSGLVVQATYEEDEAPISETNYKVTDASGKEYVHNETVLDKAADELVLTVTVTAGEISMSDTFTIGVFSGISVQAEAVVSGETPTDESYVVLSDSQVEIKTDCTYTGTGYLGSIYGGGFVEFHIWSDKAVEDCELVLVVASTWQNSKENTMRDMDFNKMFEVYIGDSEEPLVLDDDPVIPGKPFPTDGTGSKWTNWADCKIGEIDLQPGFNVVKVLCIGSERDDDGQLRTPNIDRLDVRFAEVVANPCTAIDITTQPKTAYVEGEKFDPTGIVFDATYTDGTEKTGLTVADIDEWTPTRALRTDDTTVTIKHDGFEKTIDITVSEKKVTSVEIVSEPVIKSFPKGSKIDLGGLKVNATYEGDAAPVEETEYIVKDSQGKTYVDGETVLDTAGELTLTVSVTSGGATMSDTFVINVVEGVITVQAEATGEHGENESYTVLAPIQSGKGVRVRTGESHSKGGACVESIVKGDKVTFYVYAEVAGDYDFVVTTCSTLRRESGVSGTLAANVGDVFKVTVGGAELDVSDVVIPELDLPEGGSIWFNWQEVDFGTVTLEAGYNEIVFECINVAKDYQNQDRVPNLDAIDLIYAGDAA